MNSASRITKLERDASNLAGKVEQGLKKLVGSKPPSAEELAAMAQLAVYYQSLADSLRRRESNGR